MTPKLHYDYRTVGTTCLLSDIKKGSLECLDYFYEDVIHNFWNTALKHKKNDMLHIPAMFGDDFAYMNARSTF